MNITDYSIFDIVFTDRNHSLYIFKDQVRYKRGVLLIIAKKKFCYLAFRENTWWQRMPHSEGLGTLVRSNWVVIDVQTLTVYLSDAIF